MPTTASQPAKRVLQPVERIAEVLFGLIMVLTFTGSLSVAEAGRDDVRIMLIGALGCNIAWGIIDAILYLMGCAAERAGGVRALRAVQTADKARAHQVLADALPQVVADVLQEEDLERIRGRLKELPVPPQRARLQKSDWLGGVAVFLYVVASTFPVVIPFMFAQSAAQAMRLSNGIAVVMLLVLGYALGKAAGRNPWLTGGGMLLLGVALVAMTMALGG